MKPRNQDGIASRRAVAERLRRFFSDLTAQLAAGTAHLWERVEHRLPTSAEQNERPSEPAQPSQLRARDQEDKS
jgi:hypothetical protein